MNAFSFLAGIALMLLGIRSLRKGSERFFGARFRQLVQTATQSRVRAFLAGYVVSLLTPSSTAVALLAVEAINGGFVNFAQALALMLGANVGFTVTVQLLAFKFYVYYPVFLVLGIPVYLFAKALTWRGAGQAVLGVGYLLLSIQLISQAVVPLKNNADVGQIVTILENHPVWLLLFAIVLKVGLQSATATIGIAIAMCAEGILPVQAAVVVVVGANIGIAVTALMAGFSRIETRRMAVGNLLFKLAGAAVVLPLLPTLIKWIEPLSFAGPTHDTQIIANAHTLFNLALAAVFLPLIPVIAPWIEKLIPARAEEPGKLGVRYLDAASLESPALALGQATREALHMADHVQTMLDDAHKALTTGDAALCVAIQKHDDVVDHLNNEIKTYITRLSEQALTAEESQREVALLSFANELETIGDIIDKGLVDLAQKKIATHVQFSKAGGAELEDFFRQVRENFGIAVAAFASQDRVLADKLLRHKHQINEHEPELRKRHFGRLRAGLSESFETSAIHLDVLTNLKHINSHLTAVAYPILETKPKSRRRHRDLPTG